MPVSPPTAVATHPREPAEPGPTEPDRPPRDLTIDLLRAVAMVAVVVGHWIVVVPSYEDGRFDGVNALATVPALHPLTWLFQVMPLFFVVGGVANAASWTTARRRGDGYGSWLRTRLARLVVPAGVLVGVGTGLAATARAVGVAPDVVEPIAWLVVVPVWFLAVYVLVVALAPVQWHAHERWGVRVPLALAGAACVVDAVRLAGDAEAVGYLNFLLVFGACQQLGFSWFDGGLVRRRTRTGALLLAGGLGGLWLLTHVGPYPVSLVGYPGDEIANNAPPTVTLLALGLAQVGLGLLARPWLEGALRRRPVQAFALVMNRNAMTVLLWHFPALVVAGLVLLPLGVVPDPTDGSPTWWATRLVTVAVLAGVLAPLVGLAGRVERRATPRPVGGPSWRPVLAVPLLAAGFAAVTVHGLSGAGPLGVPVLAVGALAAGAALVTERTRRVPEA